MKRRLHKISDRPHGDAQGSITAVTNESGAVLTRYRYDPWGKQTLVSGSNTGISQTRQGHTGHEMLDGGLTHMNGRLYDPLISRFVSADPIVQAPYDLQSLNRYSYVWNNPLGYIDPNWGTSHEGKSRLNLTHHAYPAFAFTPTSAATKP